MAGYHAAAMQTYGSLGATSISEQIDNLLSKGLARQIGVSATKPVGIPEVTIDELLKLFGAPFYKKWWFWAGVGTIVVGGGFFFLRRRRK